MRRVFVTFVLTLFCLSGISIAQAAPVRFEFKGDRLGMSLFSFKRHHMASYGATDPSGTRCTDEPPLAGRDAQVDDAVKHGLVDCLLDTTIVGHEAKDAMYRFVDVKLYTIFVRFPHDGFPKLMAAMRSKYGTERTVSVEPLQNLFGARFDGRTAAWKNGSDAAYVREYDRDRETSGFAIIDIPASLTAASRTPQKAAQDF